MPETLADFVRLAGVGQLGILVASSLVPFRLNWKQELGGLAKLHRQMYWVYGGYVVMAIIAFGFISIFCAEELASGSPLARGVCIYITVFWGIRLALQAIFDAKPYMTAWWLKVGYHTLTVLFAGFTIVFGYAAIKG